jgi:hypothetical protein
MQTWNPTERTFTLYSLKIDSSKFKSNSCLRLHPLEEKRATQISSHLPLKFMKHLELRIGWLLAKKFWDSLINFMKYAKRSSDFEVKLTLDVTPNSGEVSFLNQNSQFIQLNFPRNDALFSEASELAREFFLSLQRTGKVKEISVYNRSTPTSKKEWVEYLRSLSYHDSAHYYGTVPIEVNSGCINRVDSKMRLYGFNNIYVIGASSFNFGHFIHPTGIIVASARYWTKYILAKEVKQYQMQYMRSTKFSFKK